MSNRIDDQNLRERMFEDRGQEIKKQTTQSNFAQKITTQKTVQKQTSTQVTESKAKAGAATTSLPKAPTLTPKAAPQKSQSKKTEEKGSTKKGADSDAKTDKKRSDLAIDTAVKKKRESKEDQSGLNESEAFFQQAAMVGTTTPTQVNETQAAAAPALSQEVINQLVDHIYSSTNSEGLQQLTIELKSGALSGAQIQVSSSGGKVKLKFSSDDPATKALLRNSKEAISQRLTQKNLSLSEFVVD